MQRLAENSKCKLSHIYELAGISIDTPKYSKMTFRIGLLIVGLLLLISVLVFGNQIKSFFSSQTTAINIISVVGTIITVMSFLYGIYEKSEREKLETKRRSQLWASLDRARYVTFDHVILEQMDKELKHDHKHRLWLVHQAACDLYI